MYLYVALCVFSSGSWVGKENWWFSVCLPVFPLFKTKTLPMPWPHVLKYYLLLQNPAISPMNSVMLLSVQFSHSVVSDFVTPWTAACQASLSITNSWSFFKLMSIKSWCHPTISYSVVSFSSCLQSFPASGSFPMSQLFTSDGQSIGSFSFSISPSNEHSRLISFRMNWCLGSNPKVHLLELMILAVVFLCLNFLTY